MKNLWLADQLCNVISALSSIDMTLEQEVTGDPIMRARIVSVMRADAAEKADLGLAWDEAIGVLKGDKFVAVIPIFLRSVFLGNTSPHRIASMVFLEKVNTNEVINFLRGSLDDKHKEILATAFSWFCVDSKFSEEDSEPIRQSLEMWFFSDCDSHRN